MKKALLIPIYEPNSKVVPFLKNFKAEDFDYFLVVNDGSNSNFDDTFKQIEEETVFKVIGYKTNKGKGFALKKGIKYIVDHYKDTSFIVTADDDGQHKYHDILKIRDSVNPDSDELVLGSRNFYQPGIPRNSRVGNKFSSKYFKVSTGKKVKDTQTGLRGIPASLFEVALATAGNRFEYEMNFLTEVARNYNFKEVDIETVYENNKNETTHFRPFVDSVIIYKSLLLYIFVSVASFGIDIGLFHIFSNYVFNNNSEQQVFISALLARIISGLFNFFMFNFVVFPNKGNIGKNAIKYWSLWMVNYGLSSGLTYLFKYLPTSLTFIKFIIDTILAIMNYIINMTWVFVKKKKRKKHEN